MKRHLPVILARTCQRGTTLLELLVTLSIAVILMSIAVPSFQNLIRTNRIASVTNEMVRALHLARSEAVNRGVSVSICKSDNPGAPTPACDENAAWDDGWLIFEDPDRDAKLADPADLIRVGQLAMKDTDLSITSNNYAKYVTYSPTGTPKGNGNLSNTSIWICMPPDERSIIINITGRIRTETGNCS
ncbi:MULTISPECIES: GspH/FimT family pseudopilin [Thiorhodovibrio]|uniref:GspH/FimT family pseudopilin n=1 Tax=Thiorhodovibrio TaxID=61593 RepID=UPI001A919AFA|nr:MULTISPECIES: GspH/FimT family pseudopilin [Thiorhodovibrio]WPL12169.1 putative major pilin subunit [Thiorhodovibrio litoralis]